MSSSVNGLGGFVTIYLKHWGLISAMDDHGEDVAIPPSFDYIFAAVYRLFRGENISHLLFRNQAACALPEKKLPLHVQVIHSDRKVFRFRTIVLVPTIKLLACAHE